MQKRTGGVFMSHIDPNAEAYYVGLMNACGYRDKDLKNR